MDIKQFYDPQVTCRICLVEKSDMTPIFQNSNDVHIEDKIFYCANITMKQIDRIPNNICLECIKELNISFKFKKKCEDSNKILSHYFMYIKNDKDDLLKIDTKTEKLDEKNASNYKFDTPLKVDSGTNSVSFSVAKYEAGKFKSMKCNIINSKLNNILPADISVDASRDKICSKVQKSKINTMKSDDGFKCGICNLQCQNKWVLKNHMRIHSGERPYQCNLCKKGFVSNSNMRMHQRLTHNEDKQVCSECGKSFSCLTYLKRHLIVHYEVKPFGCTICQKRFNTKSYLKEHIARHKGDKRFFCEVCGSKFISDVNLKQHMVVHGIQKRNFKRHQCTFCDYKTMGKVDLARHMRKHTGEKPFRCPEEGCQSAFAGKGSLKLHIRIHTGEKPYECSECPAKFSRGDKCKNHMLKRHNVAITKSNKRSKLIIKELAEAVENGQVTSIPMDIIKISNSHCKSIEK